MTFDPRRLPGSSSHLVKRLVGNTSSKPAPPCKDFMFSAQREKAHTSVDLEYPAEAKYNRFLTMPSLLSSRSRWRTNGLIFCIVCLALYIFFFSGSKPESNGIGDTEINIAEIEREIDNRNPVHSATYSSLFKDVFDKLPPVEKEKVVRKQQANPVPNYRDYAFEKSMKYHRIWDWAAKTVSDHELYPEVPEVDEVLHALETARIVHVDVLDIGTYESGTSEKWVVVLEGGQKAMMKIVWENKGKGKFEARCNNGFEIPTAEIAAFRLHRLLGFRNTPYVTGRRVDLLHEVLPAASPIVAKQIVNKNNQTCVIGKCYFCRHTHTLCPKNGIVEVSISYWVPRHLKLHTFPPRYMPYSTPNMKQWGDAGFNNQTYCKWTQKNQHPYERTQYYYDLFDFGVLDTIMYHYDSKHYTIEDNTPENGLTVRLDHGRSFCSNDRDDDHVFLAPVTQCCTLRKSTWEKLQRVRHGETLSRELKETTDLDPIAPILEEKWYPVLERRLKIVTSMVERCADANGWDNVLV